MVCFILKAENAACSFKLRMVVSLFFIGEIFDIPRTKSQRFELVFTTSMYAVAPYALLAASGSICDSTFSILVDL